MQAAPWVDENEKEEKEEVEEAHHHAWAMDGGRQAIGHHHYDHTLPAGDEEGGVGATIVGGSLDDGGRTAIAFSSAGDCQAAGVGLGAEFPANLPVAPLDNNFWFMQSTRPSIWLHAHRWEMKELKEFQVGKDRFKQVEHKGFMILLERGPKERDSKHDQIFLYDAVDVNYRKKIEGWKPLYKEYKERLKEWQAEHGKALDPGAKPEENHDAAQGGSDEHGKALDPGAEPEENHDAAQGGSDEHGKALDPGAEPEENPAPQTEPGRKKKGKWVPLSAWAPPMPQPPPKPWPIYTIHKRRCRYIVPDVHSDGVVREVQKMSPDEQADLEQQLLRTTFHSGAQRTTIDAVKLFAMDTRLGVKQKDKEADFSLLFKDEIDRSSYVHVQETRERWDLVRQGKGHKNPKMGMYNQWIIQSKTPNVWLHAHMWEDRLIKYLQDRQETPCWGEFPMEVAKRYRGCVVKRGVHRINQEVRMYDLDYKYKTVINRECRVLSMPIHFGAKKPEDGTDEALKGMLTWLKRAPPDATSEAGARQEEHKAHAGPPGGMPEAQDPGLPATRPKLWRPPQATPKDAPQGVPEAGPGPEEWPLPSASRGAKGCLWIAEQTSIFM